MRGPKKLTIQIPIIDYPHAVLLQHNQVNTPESDKDFELGELYVPSVTRPNKLSPRKDISPSIFNVSRKERRKHPSNFEQKGLTKIKSLATIYNNRKEQLKKQSIFNTNNTKPDPGNLYKKSHPTKFLQ